MERIIYKLRGLMTK